MTFIKVNPKRRRKPVFDQFIDELWKDFQPHVDKVAATKTRPAVNISENNDAYVLDLAVPGLEKEDLKIEVDKGLLSVSAVKEKVEKEGEKFKRREFDFTNFKRSFRLPKSVDVNNIKAAVNNGVLTLTLGKKEEAKEQPARTVEIK